MNNHPSAPQRDDIDSKGDAQASRRDRFIPRVLKSLKSIEPSTPVFLVVGTVTTFFAVIARDVAVLSAILANLAAFFISLVILSYLYVIAGEEPIAKRIQDLLARVDNLRRVLTIAGEALEAGLVGLKMTSETHISRDEWLQRLSDAKSAVDLAGIAQYQWTKYKEDRQVEEIVRAGIERGCRYRILLYAPALPSHGMTHPIRQLTKHEHRDSVGTHNEDSLRFYHELLKLNVDGKAGRVELKVVDSKIQYERISRFDNEMFVVPYLFSRRSENCPSLLVRGVDGDGSLFHAHLREFEELWAENTGRKVTATELEWLFR